ncbi:lysine N(6)-hydroxylase/L-ornithine N(5)-oxygenase family protein [Halobacillus sp. H74]|uniref:lysine N(6)-hydroxylase/L-ornithine N(5)-oxygenase family protein n=1 Tax=Halobacillus sp. H74 TaxID=3457436 RepID=UPI003FCD54F9
MNEDLHPSTTIHHVIGIGLGPFNLGMAALMDSIDDIHCLFLEKEPEFEWHPGMLIEGTTLQVPFLADLVSMIDVKNEYSFLNYLQEHNRLYHFYFLEKFHIPRKEYNHYCRWVCRKLDSCRFEKNVLQVEPLDHEGKTIYQVTVEDMKSGTHEHFLTENIVMGIGTEPGIPEPFREHLGSKVFHTSEYLSKRQAGLNGETVAVIGSGQSAAEVFLDVAKQQQISGGSLEWYTRSNGFFPMEYSKLGLEYFSPDYIDFFYELPQWKKDDLLQNQELLYKGISAETIGEIYDHLYERSIGDVEPPLHLQAMTEMTDLRWNGDTWTLNGIQRISEEDMETEADVVILGTGYQQRVPGFLKEMNDVISWDESGRFQVRKDYALETSLDGEGEIYVQNGEIHSHGVGAPDLGLGAYRNAVIINQIAGREVFPIPDKHVFQTFGTVSEHNSSYAKIR